MANIKSFPNNQNEYVGAEWLMRWFHGRTSGVFGANDNARVSAVQGAMQVAISDGLGWLSNSEGDGIVWWNDNYKSEGSLLTLNVDMADGVLDRIDRVVVTWETTNYIALPTISILKGTPSSTAAAPALTNNTIQRQISLAKIMVNAGITSLTSMLVIDERTDPSVCGIVNETISVDTSDLFDKYIAAVAELRTAIDEAWSGEISPGAVSMRYTATIPANGWSGSEPSSCVVSVPGLLATDNPIIDLIPSSNYETADSQMSGYSIIYRAVAGAGTLTVYAIDIPEIDLPIAILCVRK